MASVLRFQDMTPSLTPPPSDRGDCDEAAMLGQNTYLPEVFYPSPAPSFSHQRPAFAAQSPDMGHSDTTYDTSEEDSNQMSFLGAPEPTIFPNTTTLQDSTIYATTMPYQQFDTNSWMSFGGYSNGTLMFPYTSEEPAAMYPSYISEAPCSTIPPIPQGVTGRSFNFSEPLSRTQDPSSFLTTESHQNQRHHSPRAPSMTSMSGISSRSRSPNLHSEQTRGRRASMMPHRSSSSSLHSFGIPVRTHLDSTTVQAWRCAFPNCTSRAVFTRGCDLRKHYNRHSKHLFCRVEKCPQSEAACMAAAQQQAVQAGVEADDPSKLAVTGGFSSKKDRARHEAKHNPGIRCEWTGANGEECGRLFSRMDNMKDHVRRIHNKGQAQPQAQQVNRRTS